MVDSPNQSTSLGVEISGTKLCAAIINEKDELIASKTEVIANDADSVSQIIAVVEATKTEFGPFDRIGIAVPGLVDRKSGRVAYSANSPQHSAFNLVEEVSSGTGLSVSIENDANAAAYGEFRIGAGVGCRNLFYATLGEGVGGAFILNDEIWRGASGFAGEFGYVPVNSEGTRLEEVASAANIIRRTRERFHQDNTSSLIDLREEAITLAEIIAAAEKEDDFAKMMLERTGVYVGTAIASVINLLNIEKIVVGGEIMSAKHLVLDSIIERARELSFAPSFGATSIVEGDLGDAAAAVGAAILSRKDR